MPFTELYFIKLNLSHKAKTTGGFFYIKNLKVKVFYITICNVKKQRLLLRDMYAHARKFNQILHR